MKSANWKIKWMRCIYPCNLWWTKEKIKSDWMQMYASWHHSPTMICQLSLFSSSSRETVHEIMYVSNYVLLLICNPQDTTRSREIFKNLEEQLWTVEGSDSYNLNTINLWLVVDVMVPPKFKVLNFEKYNGVKCPKNHLIMYCRKMSPHTQNDKLLIHLFQDSLTGAASSWYTHLKKD